jgi:predicted transcriptional regulator
MDKFDARQAALDLVTAFVNNNSLNAQELPSLLSDVYEAIARFGETKADVVPPAKRSDLPLEVLETPTEPEAVVDNQSEAATARVSIEQSLRDPNYILSMITGEKLKTLTRHLRRHGLDAQQYRARYNLAEDYPMVAPAYSQFRRDVAKKMALGRVGRAQPVLAPASSPEATVSSPANDPSAKAEGLAANASSIQAPKEAKPAGKAQQIDTTPKAVRTSKRAAATSHAFVNSDAKPETLSDTTLSRATSAMVANNVLTL